MFQEKRKVTEQLEDSRLRLKDEMDLYREVLDQLWLLRHQFHKEKEAMQEVSSAPSAFSSNQHASHSAVRTQTDAHIPDSELWCSLNACVGLSTSA